MLGQIQRQARPKNQRRAQPLRVLLCGFPDLTGLCLRLEEEEVGALVGAEMGFYHPRGAEDSSGENRNILSSLFLLRTLPVMVMGG